MKKHPHFSLFYGLIALAVATLPFTKFLMLPIAILLIINFIAEWNWKEKGQNVKQNGAVGLLCAFLVFDVLYVAGLAFSDNLSYGLSDLECKIAFLVAPLTILTTSRDLLTRQKVRTLLWLFTLSCALSALTSAALSTAQFIDTQDVTNFFYMRLAHFLHPSYSALYCTLAFFFVAQQLFCGDRHNALWQRLLMWFLLALFVLYIYFLQSKAGILVFGGCFLLYFLWLINAKKLRIVRSVVFITCCLLVSYVSFKVIKLPMNRLQVATEDLRVAAPNAEQRMQSSTQVRLLLWRTAFDVGAAQPLFGVGTGDVEDAFLAAYEQQGLTTLHDRNLNAHNQYLQTFVACGALGLLALLALFALPFWQSLRRRAVLMLIFVIAVALHCLVESMLEVRAGSYFIAIWLCVLSVRSATFSA